MQITIDTSELQKRKLMVLTPMYGGVCYQTFCSSFAALCIKAQKMGIHLEARFLTNESLIPRARNYVSDYFLNHSDCTHAIFIDADIGFNPDDVIVMLAAMSDESPYDIMCGPYPKKNISWEKVKLAVDKGAGDKDPNELANYIGDYVLTPLNNGISQVSLSEPFEVSEAGTGFMMIRRKTFDVVKKATPHLSYTPNHIRSDIFDGKTDIHAFFHCEIDPDTNTYMSEDYFFCKIARKAGLKVWMVPDIVLTHTGTYEFSGSLGHLASIGADATAFTVAESKAGAK
jgi:hypothetical protein